jgi:hypothetical protein
VTDILTICSGLSAKEKYICSGSLMPLRQGYVHTTVAVVPFDIDEASRNGQSLMDRVCRGAKEILRLLVTAMATGSTRCHCAVRNEQAIQTGRYLRKA